MKLSLACLTLLVVVQGSLARQSSTYNLCTAEFAVKVALGNYRTADATNLARYYANIIYDYKGTAGDFLRSGPTPLYIPDSTCIDTTLNPGIYVVLGSIASDPTEATASYLNLDCSSLIASWKWVKEETKAKNDNDLANLVEQGCNSEES